MEAYICTTTLEGIESEELLCERCLKIRQNAGELVKYDLVNLENRPIYKECDSCFIPLETDEEEPHEFGEHIDEDDRNFIYYQMVLRPVL